MATTNIAQVLKQQILTNLQALVAAGALRSIIEVDKTKDALNSPAPVGYPLAIVGIPKISSDFEDQSTNQRTYRFDILFLMNPQDFRPPTGEYVEILMDKVLNQFDNNFTLAGYAQGATLPMEVQGVAVSTPDRTLLAFVGTLQARALYTVT